MSSQSTRRRGASRYSDAPSHAHATTTPWAQTLSLSSAPRASCRSARRLCMWSRCTRLMSSTPGSRASSRSLRATRARSRQRCGSRLTRRSQSGERRARRRSCRAFSSLTRFTCWTSSASRTSTGRSSRTWRRCSLWQPTAASPASGVQTTSRRTASRSTCSTGCSSSRPAPTLRRRSARSCTSGARKRMSRWRRLRSLYSPRLGWRRRSVTPSR
mmetsp:Transcript_7079/g.23233  ORF Transcript_7079/g.23233 Transcript_7079/m.23233 type:complete len:215 (+) Transcript_7079:639-1283(+)